MHFIILQLLYYWFHLLYVISTVHETNSLTFDGFRIKTLYKYSMCGITEKQIHYEYLKIASFFITDAENFLSI